MRLGLTFFAALGLISACQPNETSQTKVVNGSKLFENDEPAVRQLHKAIPGTFGSVCTGTFLTAETLLTAAHCVNPSDAQANSVFIAGGRVRAERVYVHPRYAQSYARGRIGLAGPYDLAVLVFPSGTSKHSKALRRLGPKVGETFKTVGYGQVKQRYNEERDAFEGVDADTNPQTGRSSKTTGTNVIRQVSNGMIRWLGVTGYEAGLQPGQDISVGSGDSGGPLVIDDKLAGVASYVSVAQAVDAVTNRVIPRNGSHYVDVTSKDAVAFFQSVAQEGVSIPGFSTQAADVQLATVQRVVRTAPGSASPYKWTVKINGDLEKVECVTYHLHSSFKPQNVIESCDRNQGFAITRDGWGGFTMNIDVLLVDGTKLPAKLKHKLDLSVAQSNQPKAEDFRVVQGLHKPFSDEMSVQSVFNGNSNSSWALWLVADDQLKSQVQCVTYSFPNATREAQSFCGPEHAAGKQAYIIQGQGSDDLTVTIKIQLKNGQQLAWNHAVVMAPRTSEIFDATPASCRSLGLEHEVIMEDLSQSPVARAPMMVDTCASKALQFPFLSEIFDMIIDQGINYAMPSLDGR